MILDLISALRDIIISLAALGAVVQYIRKERDRIEENRHLKEQMKVIIEHWEKEAQERVNEAREEERHAIARAREENQ